MFEACKQKLPGVDPAGASHPNELVPQRLETAGLDGGYLNAVVPELVAEIKRVCAACTAPERCRHDFQYADANDTVSRYCPNTATIDALMLERATGLPI